MQEPQRSRPQWPMFYYTEDQLEAAMAHPDFSSFKPYRNRTYGIDGYLVTFGKPALQRAAQLLNQRRADYEATKRGEQQ